jgi:hypothetical protein
VLSKSARSSSGGLLVEDEALVVFQVPPLSNDTSWLGHLVVKPRRHCADFAGLEPAAATLEVL